jgi:hypothetical protein
VTRTSATRVRGAAPAASAITMPSVDVPAGGGRRRPGPAARRWPG